MRRWTVLIVSMLVLAACEPVPPTTPPIVTPTRGIITPVSTPEDEALPPPAWTRCDSLGDTAAPGYVNQATEITVLDPGAGADSAQGPSAPVYFVDGQLIVTGRAAEIEEVIELANKNLGNQRLQPGRQTGGKTDGVIGRLVTIQGMETRLYEFQPGDMDALAVMDEVRQASLDLKRPVFADLNYVLTATPPRTCRAGSSSILRWG